MSKNQYLESISSIVSTTKLSLKCLLLTVTILSLLTSISKQSEGDSTQALTNKPSISDMNVLFPICKNKSIFECKEVYYKIKGHNGCFDWNLEDESFIKIKKNLSKQSEKSNCYDSVIVYTKVNSDPKTSVYLYSVDKNTNHKFKTKIGFGYISKLTIFKRFAYLNTGENLELGVIGKDENNNSFSSLEGYSFSWKIVNKKLDNSSMKNNTSVINEESFNTAELLKLSTEDKDLSEYREKVEKLKFSDLVLLHGITTGKVDVYAELNDNSYEIKSAPKEVVIKEDFDLEPPEVWMTPDTDFTFHLTLVLERVVDVQNLISKTYHVSPKITKKFVDPAKFKFYLFNLTNTKCGIVSSKDIVNFRSGSTPCETNLNINDFRLPDYNNAQAIIHVVNPEYLDLGVQELSKSRLELFQSILNSNKSSQKSLLNSLRENEFLDNQIFKFNKKWSLLTGKYYLIKNFFKTNEQSLVFNEIDVVFNTEFAELKDYIEVVATVFNSNIILVKAVKATTDFYNVISKTKKPIDTSVLKNIRIYDSISISKFGLNRFFLPYLENDSQELRLLVSGGSGIYKIASNNNSVIEVKNNILYGKELGVAEITVFDSSLENNFDTIEVEVRKVESIYSLEARQEVEVGSSARITYSSLHNSNFYNKANNLNNNDKGLFVFTNCTSIKFDHDFSLHQNYVSSSNGNTYNYNQQEKEKSKNDMEVKINNYKLDDIIKTLKGEDFRSRLIEEIPKRLLELSLIDQDNFDSRGAFRTISEPSSHTSFINLSNNYLNINYLEYANFGLCGVSSVESKVSGFVTVTRSNIINNTRNISDFIKLSLPFIPALRPDIQFFSALTQRSPSTSDIHNLKMLGRVTFDKAFVQNQIIISPNSRVAVDFSGGILAWNALKSSSETISSYKQILSYKKIINSGTENNGRESQELSETTANSYIKTEFIDIKKLLFSCYYETPFDLIVKLTTFNESSEFLKNPKSTEISLLVSCKYPSYYSMNIEDDYDKPDVLKIPQRRDIMYTRQINSLANIRIYAFDDKLRIFTQHNGTKGNLTKKSEYEEVEYIEEEDSNTNSFEKSLGALYYISKRIMIRNSISRFPVEFVSAYNQVSQSILINAVNQAYLTPREIKLYLHSENFYEFEIINGSGEFILDLTDTSIGVISYDKNVDKRKFRFIPKKLGLVEILLKDKNFSLSEIVSRSTVIVADISKIQIFAPPYLMIGNEIKAVVKVYDKKGVAFSEQQVEKMGLKVRKSAYEDQGLQYLEEDYNKEKDNDLISKTFNKLNQHKVLILNREITSHLVLQGAFEGVQALSVVSNNDIQSNIVHIQVFEKVEVFPPVLLLYPGSEFTLKIIGGPENEKSLNKIFSIADPEIASIGNSTPRVYAKKIGISEVKINFVFKSDENQLYSTEDEREYYSSIKEYKLCEILVPVQVAFPERVEIEGANNRRLYVNSAVRFLASLKLGDRSFTYGIGDIEFSWTVDNPHLAKFNTKTLNNNTNKCGENSNTNSNNNFSNEEARSLAEYSERIGNEYSVGLSATSNQIGSFLVAYNYGAITIKLSTKINYPAPYESHRPNLFITKKMVSVEENVWVDVAEFYDKNPNKSSLYLLPFHIGHELRTHKKEQVRKN